MKDSLKLKMIIIIITIIVTVLMLYPLYQVVILSIKPSIEIRMYITLLERHTTHFIPTYFIPRVFSSEQFRNGINALFLRAFFVSLIYTITITVMQFVVSFVMGFVFAKTRFKGRDIFFFLYIMAMVLPFHVTLVPLNQILHQLNLFNTPWAVLLPAIFSPLGVFLMRQFISRIPDELLEAATIDGAGLLRVFTSIIMPTIRNGIVAFLLFTTTMQWGAFENSMAFVRDEKWHPMALLLRALMNIDNALIFAPSVLYVLPMILIFAVLVRFFVHDSLCD